MRLLANATNDNMKYFLYYQITVNLVIECWVIFISHKVAKYEYPPVQTGVDDSPLKQSPERALYQISFMHTLLV